MNKIALATIGTLSCLSCQAQDYDCMIEPAQTVEIRSPVVGILERVHAKRGDPIRQGQVLISIESSVESSAAESAKARAEAQGQSELSRAKVSALRDKARRLQDLHAEEFVSAQAVEDVQAELKLAEAELRAAKENNQIAHLDHRQAVDQLRRRQLIAPFSGVVVDQYLYPGALVDAGDAKKPVLKIAQTNPLHVQALLPVKAFMQMKVGQVVSVTPEAPFDRPIQARIRTVDKVVDASAGTFGIVAELENSKGNIPAGLRCKVAFVVR
ncbi:efflux RND transporter periplasmic adaptor subunit [Paucibacter sp. Y2R2-4]|uniref:efflux RND transporter periplasmic adaptor subunit n=1 Tax=Paucibacter sp. Y2R2-4 TaxID=2893553 RepID=UPI0021E4E2FD|nr:efflux RND transporter periplasmic adaptor subunit [Paucibacter sp. Y2R2-4]MCV2351106.1 efflux RND transporter periplasmic adaptor subunit [Paucibacter sp. Y2R2-4]